MATIVPPNPGQIDQHSMRQWHQVFKTPWEDLVAIGYVNGATHRMWTNRISALESGDGEVALFGEAVLEPELQVAVPTSNETFYVNSSSASDTGVAKCWMVDEDGDETVIDKTLTGTTPVSIGSYVHCNMVMYLGSFTQNLGNVYVSTKSDAGVPLIITDKVQCHIAIGNGHGNNPTQLCPNSNIFIFQGIDMTVDKLDGVDFKMYKDITANGTIHRMQAEEWIIFQAALSVDHITPVAISAGQTMCMTATRIGSGSAAEAHCNIDMVVLANNSEISTEQGANLLFTE